MAPPPPLSLLLLLAAAAAAAAATAPTCAAADDWASLVDAAAAVEGGAEALQLLQVKAGALSGGHPRHHTRAAVPVPEEEPADHEEEPVQQQGPETNCAGTDEPCPRGFSCAVKADKSFSQCVPCTQLQFQRDCASWDNDLRLAATKVCGRPCMKKPPVPPCLLGSASPEYNSQNCAAKPDGSMTMTCSRASPDSCGTRLGADHATGAGRYSVSMKAAPGQGVATTFYLYTWGEDNQRSRAWSEIDMEVLGKMAGTKKSLVWTNFFTGPFNASAPFWRRQEEHPKYIEVPFDVTADYHEFTIHVGDGTIEWLVDGMTYRSEDVRGYPDMMDTISGSKFRAYLALWGQNATSGTWEDMGFLDDRLGGDFPLRASYKDVKVPP